MKHRTALSVILLLLLHLTGECKEILKIAVDRAGNVTANGSPASVEALEPMLRDLAQNKGEIWYYREAPEEKITPNAAAVLKAIRRYDLPLRISTKADYSDGVVVRALAIYAPKPEYPASAREHGIGGHGEFVLHVNRETGLVNSVSMDKTTGVRLLDRCAVSAFKRWKFKPREVKENVRIPITFSPNPASMKPN